jgi:hypothetical protein
MDAGPVTAISCLFVIGENMPHTSGIGVAAVLAISTKTGE